MKISYDYTELSQELLEDIKNHDFDLDINGKIMILREEREHYNPIVDYFNITDTQKEQKGCYYEILNVKDVIAEMEKINSIF